MSEEPGSLASQLKNALIERINQRRTIWSDIHLFFNYPSFEQSKSLFYVEPKPEAIEEQIKSLVHDAQHSEVDEYGMKRNPDNISSATLLQQIKIFQTANIKSEQLIRISEIIDHIKPTSIDSERCFSVCSRILTPTRNSLGDKKFNKIVFIYENRDIPKGKEIDM